MKKKQILTTIAQFALCLLPIAYGFMLWPWLPERIPTHFNAAGVADGYQGKLEAILWMPLFFCAMEAVVALALRFDPKAEKHSTTLRAIGLWTMPVLGNLVQVCVFALAMGMEVPITQLILTGVGGLVLAVGNYLPKCKQNYTMGIRVPWTLDDPENWNKTHRFAGYLWMIGGAVLLLTPWFGLYFLLFPVLLVLTLLPIGYSFFLYMRKKQNSPQN